MTLQLGTLCLLLWLSILVGFGHAENNTECKLPESWQGRWYQNPYYHNFVVIDDTDFGIHDKNFKFNPFPGWCKAKHDEAHYIFENGHNCTRCIQIVGLHPNVLKYMKSECMEDGGFSDYTTVCSTIGSNLELGPFYMFRVNPPLTNCPFRPEDHFQMGYTKQRNDATDTKECSHYLSTAQTCLNQSEMLISYEACVGHGSSKRDKLSCIGSWTSGPQTYFVAILYTGKNSGPATLVDEMKRDEHFFRCFAVTNVQSSNDTLKHKVSISEVATCNGLSGSESGETNLNLYKSDSCDFPRWFASKQWHTLDHELTISNKLHGQKLTPSEMVNVSWVNSEAVQTQKLSCIRQVSHLQYHNSTTILTRVSSPNCEFKLMCLVLTRLTDNLTLYQSWVQSDQITNEDFQRNCLQSPDLMNEDDFTYDERTLISKTGKLIDCPHPGVYTTNHIYKHKDYTSGTQSLCNATKFLTREVIIGCDDPKQITFVHDNDNCENGLDIKAECYGSWIREDAEYLIIRDPYKEPEKEPSFLCITISKNETNDRVYFDGVLGSCSQTSFSSGNSRSRKYLSIGMIKSESCHQDSPDPQRVPPSENESRDNEEANSSGGRIFVKFPSTFAFTLLTLFFVLLE